MSERLNSKQKANVVPITPAQGVYRLFGSFDYTPWQALGEFVDNSVSSWWRHDEEVPLRVAINWDPDFGFGDSAGRLVIVDNALGIASGDINRAFELATPPEDRSKLNQFGVGMKVAACWFGNNWVVETSALGEPVKRIIRWDTDEIVNKKLKELEVIEEPESIESHYTVITITNLLHPPSHPKTIGKIKKHLPKLFRKFSEGFDVEISWNGEVLRDSPPGVLKAPFFKEKNAHVIEWERNFGIDLSGSRRVEGYACVFDKFDRQQTGLNYFWRGRLIQGNVEPFHRPQELFGAINSFRSGRLYIEIYADEFGVTSDKTAIDFGKSKLREGDLLDAIKKVLSDKEFPLLQQAENYRSTELDPEISPRIDRTLEIVSATVEEVGTRFLNESDAASLATPDVESGELGVKYFADRTIHHKLDGADVSFQVSCVDAGANAPWISIEWDSRPNVCHSVFLNLAHPFIQRHLTPDNLSIFIGFGVSMLYGEYKALALVEKDELRVVRSFVDRFMRYMANYEDDLDEDGELQ